MKRSIKLAVTAALALGATSAFATNGDNLIGIGAKARGMGGIGIGMSHGAESALVNPALISSVKGYEIAFGGTIFMPSVKTNMGQGSETSDADMNIIPEVAIANQVNDNFYWGIGIFGTAGMGVDYRGTDKNMNMVTNLQLMQFAVPLTYARAGFSVGVAPILQYGALDINYAGQFLTPGGPADVGAGAGVAQDFGFGFNIGVAYDFGNIGLKGLTVGASYKSEIDMEYDEQLSSATAPFVAFGAFPEPMKDNLEQPAEMGIGLSYNFMKNHTVAFDYKYIGWDDAKGYGDFGWENQSVFIVGYEYATDKWAARIGYNYGENPVAEQDGTTQAGAALNMFNLVGFPATTESHVTVGGTYAFNKTISVDGALTYAPETTEEYDISGLGQPVTSVETKHSQTGISVALVYNF